MSRHADSKSSYTISREQDMNETVIYQSIFLTEHSIMRVNSIDVKLIPQDHQTGTRSNVTNDIERRGVQYLVSRRGLYIPLASRALDPLLLVYAAARGYLWSKCGFEYVFLDREECSVSSSTDQVTNLDDLFRLLEETIYGLVNTGYLYPLPYTAISEDTTSPGIHADICKTPDNQGSLMSNMVGLSEFLSIAERDHIMNEFSSKFSKALGITNAQEVWRKLVDTAKRINEKYKFQVGYEPKEDYCVYFKTLHGELGRLVENARSLPHVIAVSSVDVLPVLIDPPSIPIKEYGVRLEEVRELIREFLERNEVNSEHAASISEVVVNSLREEGIEYLTPYQFEVLKEYFTSSGDKHKKLLVLTSPTGTGKTIVFAVIALTLSILWKLHGQSRKKIVIVYPRRSLESQQLERLLRLIIYINEHEKTKQIVGDNAIKVHIRDKESLKRSDVSRIRDKIPIRGITIGNKNVLHQVEIIKLGNREICLYRSEPSYVYDVKENCYLREDYDKKKELVRAIERADIIITNHSMLFKIATESFTKSYYKELLEDTGLIILDEAHVFFDQSYSHVLQSVSLIYALFNPNLNIIFSSATISEEHLIPENLVTNNIIGILRRRMVNKPVIESKVKSVLPLISNDSSIVIIDYFEITYKHLLENPKRRYKGPMKLTFWYVADPYPFKRASTSLEEIIVSLAHLINGVRRRNQELSNTTMIVYVDYKATLKDIVGYLTSSILVHAVDHADRVLLCELGRNMVRNIVGSDVKIREEGLQSISGVIRDKMKTTGNLLRIIWDLDSPLHKYFSRFHVLTPYLDDTAAQRLSRVDISPHSGFEKSVEQIVGEDIVKCLISEAHKMLEKTAWESDEKMLEFAQELKHQVCTSSRDRVPYFIVHHGDFHESRKYLDNLLMSKTCHKPLFVIATSTLELGIDVPSVLAVIQYGVTASSSNLVQRVGRSGRDYSTRFISTGVLVLRNDGRDNFFMDDYHVTRYIYNSESITIPEIVKDSVMLVRLALTIQRKARGRREIGKEFLDQLKRFSNLDSIGKAYKFYDFHVAGKGQAT